MNKLDLTKKVQTRDGRPVDIKITDARNDAYPIVGYIDDENNFSFWTADGSYAFHSEGERDLINAPEWRLPDPPHGYEWHRTDWTEEMLPDGWRPQYVGEQGNYECSFDGIHWTTGGLPSKPIPKSDIVYCRTKAPLPLPKPQMREVELCADDIKAGDEFLVGRYRHTWLSIKDGYVTYGSGGIYSFEEMMQKGHKIRSMGETEWRKCSKQEEVPA